MFLGSFILVCIFEWDVLKTVKIPKEKKLKFVATSGMKQNCIND